MKGKVKFFNRTKNFGFITGEDEQDYFVHISQIQGQTPLNDAQDVEFDAAKNERGLSAQNVKAL